jgi:putative acetyltransferase
VRGVSDAAGFDIRPDDLSGEATRDLLRLHLQAARANSPPGSVFALDLSGLKRPDILVWSAWRGDRVAGIGALRIDPGLYGEVKSMRTHPDFLRCGIAGMILARIVAEARARGLARLSLETGTGPAFEPALALYRRHGFADGESFAGYPDTPFSRFLHLPL